MKKNIKARRVFLNYSKQNVNFITFECLSILRGTFQENANETIAVREECNVKVGIP